MYSRQAKSFQKILGPLFGLNTLFSPDGSHFLASATQEGGIGLGLAVYSSNGTYTFSSPTAATVIQKCAWANDRTVYCAVPRQISGVWPDAYLKGINTSDRMVRIDIGHKEITEVFNQGNLDISEISISKDQGYLFFVNRVDGTLWRYRIKD